MANDSLGTRDVRRPKTPATLTRRIPHAPTSGAQTLARRHTIGHGRHSLALLVTALLLLLPHAPILAADGLFADFVTSLGTFTCELEFNAAPQTVASFVGLATGERPWLDLATGRVQSRPFYNGTTFHRVISGFMIQGGSPNGQGTDGPGYTFTDEFEPSLRHDSAGILSMANSGPDSNGSQFFVTVASTPHLNDLHTVFGRVVEGLEVVQWINGVDTKDARPLTPVVVESVIIRRVGGAANAFDIQAQSLPEVRSRRLRIERDETGQPVLHFESQPFTDLSIAHSTDLEHWSRFPLGVDLGNPVLETLPLAPVYTSRFFSLASVQYPDSTRAPRSLDGDTLTLSFQAGLAGTLSLSFNAGGQGAYSFNGTPGTIVTHTWEQAVYRGYLWPVLFSEAEPPPLTLVLSFATESNGTFTGTAHFPSPTPQATVRGTFTLERP